MTRSSDPAPGRKFALYSGIAALLAFIACNGLIAATALLALFGIGFNINPHLQAILISIFAALTSVFIFKGYRRHRIIGPLLLAIAGAAIIILTLYISYDKLVETLGLLILIAAAGWNWQAARRRGAAITGE